MMRARTLRTLLTIGGLASLACVGVGPLDPTAAEMEITPPDVLLTAIGAEARLQFTLGDGLSPSDVVWRSSAPSVATVDTQGLVRAVGDGTATITAQVGGVSDTTTVTVAATILNVIRVRAQQTDPNQANNVSTVSVTVTAD